MVEYKFKFDTKQKIVEIINLLILIIMIGYLIINWNNISDTVPSHYNILGQIDSWGSKESLIIFPILAAIINFSLGTTLYFPNSLSIPVKVTEQNCDRVYGLTKNLINITKTTINILFLYINIISANSKPLGVLFLPIFLTLVFLPMIVYFIKIKK